MTATSIDATGVGTDHSDAGPDRPTLTVLAGGRLTAVNADQAWWEDLERTCARHRGADLTPSAYRLLDAFRSAALSSLEVAR